MLRPVALPIALLAFYVADICAQNGGYYNGATLPPATVPPNGSTAGDNHPYCCYWAANNECDTNPNYMRTECQRSCGTFGCKFPDVASCQVRVNIDGCLFDPDAPRVPYKPPVQPSPGPGQFPSPAPAPLQIGQPIDPNDLIDEINKLIMTDYTSKCCACPNQLPPPPPPSPETLPSVNVPAPAPAPAPGPAGPNGNEVGYYARKR